jgi:AAA ATPase domain
MNALTLQKRSPFKFLDSYNKNDKNIFFGRDEEIKALYELVQTSKLVLVYGASGTGKTSLVECGLSNKFSEADWFDVRIRRGNVPLLDATLQAINRKLKEEANPSFDLPQSVEALYYHNFIPIYLIFDQFEELFILGDEKERDAFFNALVSLVRVKVPCKILLIVREEYLAFFHDYEALLPIIYDNRFRIERMNQLKLERVIQGTIQAPQYEIEFSNPEENTRLIIENLRNERHDVDLTNLQVYLDRLYKVDIQRAEQNNETRPPYKFDKALIENVGKLPQVIAVFLDEQMQDVDKTINYSNAALTILKLFVTNEGTKRNRSVSGIIEEFTKNNILPIPIVEDCINVLYERRILKELKIGEELRYEISHDLLAGQVYQRFSIEEKEVIRAERMIKDGFEFHKQLSTEGTGVSFLREEQIFFIQNLKTTFQLTTEEQSYFEDSIEEAEVERNKEKRMLEKELELQKAKAEQEEKAKVLQLELFEKEKQEHERQKQEAIKESERQKQEAIKEREQQALNLKRQNRKLLTAVILGVIMAGMLVMGIYALVQLNKQKDKTDEANKALNKSKDQAERDAEDIKGLLNQNKEKMLEIKKKEYEFFLAQAETHKSKNEFTAAISSLEGAKRIDSTTAKNIDGQILELAQEGRDFERQKNLDDSLNYYIVLGSNYLDDENALKGKLLKPEIYNNALFAFTKANNILGQMKLAKEANIKRVKDKLKEATITASRAIEGYKEKGERFMKAKGWKEAIDNYEKALNINTIEDKEKVIIKQLISTCRDTMEIDKKRRMLMEN